ncbi:MAG TPA: hypothetical protein VK154_17035 [Chitinophagales bacterium]|nr:hypothetical protein [Chitinophagales bacterium]
MFWFMFAPSIEKKMYTVLTLSHNYTRWLVLVSLLFALYRAFRGYLSKSAFTKTDNAIRHWTATISHIQLVLGMLLYFQSPLVKYFWANSKQVMGDIEFSFFGLYHIALMFTAVIIITMGSALAKRREPDSEKFKTMLVWFTVALIIIFIAIPWPFSPFANRPYYR